MQERDNGYILLTTLFISSVLAAVLFVALLRLHSIPTLYRREIQSVRDKSLNRRSLISEWSARSHQDLLSCLTGADPSISLCTRSVFPQNITPFTIGKELDPTHAFPVFNYNHLFKNSLTCNEREDHYGSTTRSGFLLTQGSVRSAYTCTKLDSLENDLISLQANLVSALPIEINRGIDAPSLTIAATGYLDLPLGISTDTSLTLLAGGDLHVSSIMNTSGKKISVTLISATGSVFVESLGGAPVLTVLAWENAFISGGELAANLSHIPPIMEEIVLGFIETEER